MAEPTRRCWRCLQQFPLDPTLPVPTTAEWWVCDACHEVLMPDRRR
jgi:hypothetical protein